jgi:micrococcal nuclease
MGREMAIGGKEASADNTKPLKSEPLRLELDVQERDQYGRLLACVWAGDVFINQQLVLDGYAQVATYPPDVK